MADNEVWVYSELPSLMHELLAAARSESLADGNFTAVTAVVTGPRSAAKQAIARGADRAAWLGDTGAERLADDYIPTLIQLVEEQRPGMVLIGSTRRGRAATGRLAARLGVTALTDVLQFMHDGDGLKVRHLIFGGGAVRVERPLSSTIVASVGPGIFDPLPPDPNREGEISEAAFVEPAWRARLVERKARPPAAVDLTAARRVVCAGRGLAQKDDLKLVQELADALGAEVACTRPLAEGLDWLPVERYIGISGATIRPDLYLGVGVSGQAQHLIGMSRSRVIVAINKDQNAPIHSQADYSIAGDLYAVVPALIQSVKGRGGAG